MARNLNMNTVAEGVETREQYDFLTHQGCHMMQGYYFGRPMSDKDFEELLQTSDIAYRPKDSDRTPGNDPEVL